MADDQKLIEKFLKKLVLKITEKYGKEIDFIILFGSAARGEFKKGVSDIDLVIQLNRDSKRKEIEDFATNVFWELNEKYKTEFEKVLSTVKSKRILDNFLKSVEREAHFYVPIFVFPPGWLDWEKARRTRPLWRPAAIFLIHQAFIFEKFKEEGKILYGRDIRPLIKPKITFWERWKAIQIPFWISLFSILILPLALKRAVKYSTKAVLYELGSALDFIGKKSPKKQQNIEALKQEATRTIEKKLFDLHFKLTFDLLSSGELEIFDKASQIKTGKLTLSRMESAKFVTQAFWIIVRTNWSIFATRYFTWKNLIKVLITLLVVAIAAYFAVSLYALYRLVHPKPKPLNFNPAEISQKYEDVMFKSINDNLNISGWFFKSDSSDKAIILVSGSDQNRIDPGFGSGNVAKDLLKNNYSVLLFDFRGRGNSEYSIHSIGYYEKYDLAGAYGYLVNRGFDPDKIGIISISLGAGTTLLTLPLIPDVGGIVLDSGYSNIRTLLERELPGRSRLPPPFYFGLSFWAKAIYKIRLDNMIPAEILKNYPQKKFLLIHGNNDEDIPIGDSIELSKASPKSELWIVPEAGHVKAYETIPKIYVEKVTAYFNEVMRQ